MKFYLYPLEKINIEKLSDVHWHFFSQWVKEAYLALAKHPNRIINPEKANYFIISISLFCLKFVKYNITEIENKIKELKYINNNKPHIIFDLSNSDEKFIKLPNLVYFKSSFHKDFYNPKCDISIPIFPLYKFSDIEIEPITERLVLASFRGDLKNKFRKKLFKYQSLDLVVKDTTIVEFEIDEELKYSILNHENLESYVNLLTNSKFTILPYGSSVGLSFRFIEALSCGSIPVIISDDHILPFNDLLNYKNFSYICKEKNLKTLEEKLKDITDLDKLQKNVILIYNTYFSDINKIINTSLMIYELKSSNYL